MIKRFSLNYMYLTHHHYEAIFSKLRQHGAHVYYFIIEMSLGQLPNGNSETVLQRSRWIYKKKSAISP